MNLQSYIKRIQCEGDLDPTLPVLKQLQKSHLLNIPFENLDIHRAIDIKLDLEKIFQKVVGSKRGGFCYELNGLFLALLNSIGYQSKRISARVFDVDKAKYGPEYDHLAIVTNLENQEYLVDVGFPEAPFTPIQLTLNKKQNDGKNDYFIDKFEDDYLRLNKVIGAESVPQYIFRNEHCPFDQFEEMCLFHQTDPSSFFLKGKIITLPTEDGRITLTNDKLKITSHHSVEETPVKDDEQFAANLLGYFGIELRK